MVDSALPEQLVVRVIGDVEVRHDVWRRRAPTGSAAASGPPGRRRTYRSHLRPAGRRDLGRAACPRTGRTRYASPFIVCVSEPRFPIVSDGGRYRLNLPTESVDAWLLLDTVDRDVGWHPSHEELLASPRSFPSVEPSLAILEAGNAIAVAQRHLIERLAALEAVHGRPFLGRLMAHATDDPTDDRLVESVATILAASGSSGEALGLDRAVSIGTTPDLRRRDRRESRQPWRQRIRGRTEPADQAGPVSAPTPHPQSPAVAGCSSSDTTATTWSEGRSVDLPDPRLVVRPMARGQAVITGPAGSWQDGPPGRAGPPEQCRIPHRLPDRDRHQHHRLVASHGRGTGFRWPGRRWSRSSAIQTGDGPGWPTG